MPLSEQEQRLLDEMERNLYHNDADYVATVGSRTGRPSVGIVALGVVIALAGVALLIVGVGIRQPLLGILGFAVMFVGAIFSIAPPQRFLTDGAPRAGFVRGVGDRFEHRSGAEHDAGDHDAE